MGSEETITEIWKKNQSELLQGMSMKPLEMLDMKCCGMEN